MDILFVITTLIFVGLMLQLYLIWSGVRLRGLWAEARRGPPPDTDVLLRWRQDALTLILTLTLIFGTPLAIADGMLMLETGRFSAAVGTAAAACMDLALVLGRRIPFRIRAGGLILQMLVYGSFRLLQNGLVGSGRIFLLSAVVLAALLLGWRAALLTWLAALAVFTGLVLALRNGAHVFIDPLLHAANSPALVFDNLLLVLWFAASLAGALAWLANRLNHSVRSTQTALEQLAAANAGLEQRVAERTSELREALAANSQRVEELLALNRVAQALMRWTDVRDAVATVSASVGALFEAREVGVWQLDPQRGRLDELAPGGPPGAAPRALLLERLPALLPILSAPQPLLLPAEALPPLGAPQPPGGGLLVMPLLVRGAPIGVLHLQTRPGRALLPADVALLQTIAGMVASALDNARLMREAQDAAAAGERQRLARDLHDSVSQALFAASVTADVIPQTWELDPEEGRELLADVRRLTRGALAEMRTLLVELRPAALTRAPLRELLGHLAAAVGAKLPGALTADLAALPALPPEVRVALYRIAQEALANVVKHAQPAAVRLLLRAEPAVAEEGQAEWAGLVELRIEDDGQGFAVEQAAQRGRFGLATMAERAAGVGAQLGLTSQPGRGTMVSVRYPHPAPAGPP